MEFIVRTASIRKRQTKRFERSLSYSINILNVVLWKQKNQRKQTLKKGNQ